MKLKDSLRAVFRNEEGLFDLATTDMDKTIEFSKGDFKRFNKGGGVADRYSSYGSYGTSSEFKANNRILVQGLLKRILQIIVIINHIANHLNLNQRILIATNSTLNLTQPLLEKLQITLLSTGKQLGILATQEC